MRSGSSGNCYYIGNEKEALLIDAGVGGRIMAKYFRDHDVDMDRISMMLVTHDHIDHIKHLGGILKRWPKPVYATRSLLDVLDRHPCSGGFLTGCRRDIDEASFLDRGMIKVKAFHVPHDAKVTLGYHIDFYGTRFSLITDTGAITKEVLQYAYLAENLIIEANYDLDMLIHGPYSPDLKARIIGGNGHLSNEQTASVIDAILKKGGCRVKNIFLCHISDNNNTPERAYDAVFKVLKDHGMDGQIQLHALPRKTFSDIYDL